MSWTEFRSGNNLGRSKGLPLMRVREEFIHLNREALALIDDPAFVVLAYDPIAGKIGIRPALPDDAPYAFKVSQQRGMRGGVRCRQFIHQYALQPANLGVRLEAPFLVARVLFK